MTTPPPEQPHAEDAEPRTAPADDALGGEARAAEAARPVPPPPPPHHSPVAYPFAPVMREPWINPRKRGAAIGTAVVGAIVALAIGFGVGFAVAPSGHRGDRMERGDVRGPGRMGGPMMGGNGPWQYPNGQYPNRRLPAQPPLPGTPSSAPAPSSSASTTR